MRRERDLIVSAIQAANRFDFAACQELLNQARALAREVQGADGALKGDALESAVDYFSICYNAMNHRIWRNTAQALALYREALSLGDRLVASPDLGNNILSLVQAQNTILPIQIRLSAATECLFVGDLGAARNEIALGEATLKAALEEIGFDLERVHAVAARVAVDLRDHPTETVVGLLGVSFDFIVTSSIIKLQYCMSRQSYSEEIQQFNWIKGVFDVFAKYAAMGSFDANVDLLRKLMHLCAAFAEALAVLVDAGSRAEQGDFAGADDCADIARAKLHEASKGVIKARIQNAAIFQQAILNMQMTQIPNMKIQWKNRRKHLEELKLVKRELEELKAERREIIQNLSRAGITVSNRNELTSAIETNIDINLKVYDQALEEISNLLRKTSEAGAADPAKIKETAAKVEDARQTQNLEQKIKKVRSIASELAGIAESAAKIAPPLAAGVAALSKMLGM
jgi:hypothetical protein